MQLAVEDAKIPISILALSQVVHDREDDALPPASFEFRFVEDFRPAVRHFFPGIQKGTTTKRTQNQSSMSVVRRDSENNAHLLLRQFSVLGILVLRPPIICQRRPTQRRDADDADDG